MDILMLGLILLIVGVGMTYVYDHFGSIKRIILSFKDRIICYSTRKKVKKLTEMEKRKLESQETIRKIQELWGFQNQSYLNRFKADVENNQKVLGRETDGSLSDAQDNPKPKKKIVRTPRPSSNPKPKKKIVRTPRPSSKPIKR